LSEEINGALVSIYNNLGQKVLPEQLIKDKVKIESLPIGLYFVKIMKGSRTLDMIKLIKE
jgi:hypothetical protein